MTLGRRKARTEPSRTAPAEDADLERGGAVMPRSDATIEFHVRGLPVAQGSTRAWLVKGRPIVTSSSKGLAAWRRLVADVAQGHAPPSLWDGPVGIRLHFGLPKPKSAPKSRRVWPDKRPDLDKLTRAVLDALTYVIFSDDSQVVEIHATKDYGAPGVIVEVHRISDLVALAD